MSITEKSYAEAKEMYANIGVDTETVMNKLDTLPISVHCWQGDDVLGFENKSQLTGGIQATGNYPGRARNADELRKDFDEAMSCLPGPKKINLHASYLEDGGKGADRDQIEPSYFDAWCDWAIEKGYGVDFNETYFSHPKSDDGTLSSADSSIREFWIEHGRRCRKIGEYFGKRTGKTCITNLWIPDGEKEVPIDTFAPRIRLRQSLDEIFKEKIDPKYNVDAVESKLFGIGMESYTVGSHEFYMGYALTHPGTVLTLDMGHFHPTELVSSKITAILTFLDKMQLHVSRPVRWDSDHVVTYSDELKAVMHEIARNDAFGRVYISLDYFDASINRVAAWAIGARNTKKAMLEALLEPTDALKKYEAEGDRTKRLALTQTLATYPVGAVWDYYCLKHNVPVGIDWIKEISSYEKNVLSKRN